MRKSDRPFAGFEISQLFRKNSRCFITRVETDMLLEGSKVNQILSFSKGGHRPGYFFFRIRYGFVDDGPQLIKPRPDGFFLSGDIFINRLWHSTVVFHAQVKRSATV